MSLTVHSSDDILLLQRAVKLYRLSITEGIKKNDAKRLLSRKDLIYPVFSSEELQALQSELALTNTVLNKLKSHINSGLPYEKPLDK